MEASFVHASNAIFVQRGAFANICATEAEPQTVDIAL